MQAHFQVDLGRFNRLINERSVLFKEDRNELFKSSFATLIREIMRNTPPHSGKQIAGALNVVHKRGWKFSDPNTATSTARAVGINRVIKDSMKLFYIVKEFSKARLNKRGDRVFLHGTREGKVVFGDVDRYEPNPTTDWMKAVRGRHRNDRGRVAKVGRDREESRAIFVHRYPIDRATFDAGVKEACKSVGKAKGGWCAGLRAIGAKLPASWVSGHIKEGAGSAHASPTRILLEGINRSPWAKKNDLRVISKSITEMEKRIANQIRAILNKRFGAGAGSRYNLSNLENL